MLTLKKPIQMKTGLRLPTASEAFCERMQANYDIMTAHIAPKDLLFLLTAPPELPEDLGGNTSLNLRNSFTEVKTLNAQMLTNVVNRIVLQQDANFHYQDQIYIDNILRKLGVENVQLFMAEVQRLREEHESLATLSELYENQLTQRILREVTAHEAKTRSSDTTHSEEPKASPVDARYYLHQSIYHRLETGAIYAQMNAFQQSLFHHEDSVTQNALRLSEQLRISRMLQVEQTKQQNFQVESLTLREHINHFELGDVLPPPQNEEEVLARAAQAALLATIDRVFTQRPTLTVGGPVQWLHLEQSFAQSAENTLARFESYHTQTLRQQEVDNRYHMLQQTIAREEIRSLQSLLQSEQVRELLVREAGERYSETSYAIATPALEHFIPEGDGEDASTSDDTQEKRLDGAILSSLTERILKGGLVREPLPQPQQTTSGTQAQEAHPTRLSEREWLQQSIHSVEVLRELTQMERDLFFVEQTVSPLPSLLLETAMQPYRTPPTQSEGNAAFSAPQAGAPALSLTWTTPLVDSIEADSETTHSRPTGAPSIQGTTPVHPIERKQQADSERLLFLRESLQQLRLERERYWQEQLQQVQLRDLRETTLLPRVERMEREVESQSTSVFRESTEESRHETQTIEQLRLLQERQIYRSKEHTREILQGEHPETLLIPRQEVDLSAGELLPSSEIDTTSSLTEQAREQLQKLHEQYTEQSHLDTQTTLRETLHEERSETLLIQREDFKPSDEDDLPSRNVDSTPVFPEQVREQVEKLREQYIEQTRGDTQEILRETLRESEQVERVFHTQETSESLDTTPSSNTVTPSRDEDSHASSEVASLQILQELQRFTTERVENTMGFRPVQNGETPPLYWHDTGDRTESEEMTASPTSDPVSATEEASLFKELQKIEERNRERYERLQTLERERTREVTNRRPDRKRIMSDALQAIHEPDALLQTLREELPDESRVPVIPPEVARILHEADPETQRIYETLLLYNQNPVAALEQGLVQVGNVGAFNAEALRFERDVLALTHPEAAPTPSAETSSLAEKKEELLDTLRELPRRIPPARQPAEERAKAPLVFRREDNSFLEELTQRLDERRVQAQTEQVTQEEIVHSSTTQVQMQDSTTRMVAQSTEDITTLVNRAMERQMSSITDQVYRQMERKLQMERSRRGKF